MWKLRNLWKIELTRSASIGSTRSDRLQGLQLLQWKLIVKAWFRSLFSLFYLMPVLSFAARQGLSARFSKCRHAYKFAMKARLYVISAVILRARIIRPMHFIVWEFAIVLSLSHLRYIYIYICVHRVAIIPSSCYITKYLIITRYT